MSEVTILVGTPGAGKTLYTMSELRKEFEEPVIVEGQEVQRQVYYMNIPGVNVDGWKKLDDHTTWHELPVGSVIIVDEAHKVFKTADWKRDLPVWVEELDTIRHRGQSIVFITQHPADLHIFIRRRCTRHIYLKRPLTQGNFATAYRWPEYNENFKDEREQKKADDFIFTYPEEAFGLYKSSQLHTKKKYVPKAAKRTVLMGVAAAIVAVLGIGYLVNSFSKKGTDMQPDLVDENGINTHFMVESMKDTLDGYLKKWNPRIESLPHTAPVYDQVTEVKQYPQLICVSSKTRCICHTQQASRANVTDKMCRDIVENGYFDPSKEEGSKT